MILTRDSRWWIAGHGHVAIVIAKLTDTWTVAIVARLVGVHLVFHIGLSDVVTRWQLIRACRASVVHCTVRFYTQHAIQLHSFSSWPAALSVCWSVNAEYRLKCNMNDRILQSFHYGCPNEQWITRVIIKNFNNEKLKSLNFRIRITPLRKH